MLSGVWVDDDGVSAEFRLDPESICQCMLDEVEGRDYQRVAGYLRSRTTDYRWKAIQWMRKSADVLVIDGDMTEKLSNLTGDSTKVVGELLGLRIGEDNSEQGRRQE